MEKIQLGTLVIESLEAQFRGLSAKERHAALHAPIRPFWKDYYQKEFEEWRRRGASSEIAKRHAELQTRLAQSMGDQVGDERVLHFLNAVMPQLFGTPPSQPGRDKA